MVESKACFRCKEDKPLHAFNKGSKRSILGLSSWCRECSRAYAKSWAAINRTPDIARDAHLRCKYGIDAKWKKSKYAEQGGLCAICGCDMGGWTKACVDHDHDTKAVRGLLCSDCNTGIGLLKDTPSILLSAAVYLGTYGKVVEVCDGVA